MAGTPTRENKMKNGKKIQVSPDFHEYEIRLTQRLQNNNDVLRRRALKEVDKWLKIRMDSSGGPLKPESFILWKGLFYALWMADKPLVQEQIAQRIASFVNLPCPFKSMEFFKYGLNIMCCEWFGIDQLRLDKFLMFVRRFLRNGLMVVKNTNYTVKVTRAFNAALQDTVLNKELILKQNSMGMTLHFIEVFLEELAKVSEGKLQPALIPIFLKPFVEFLADTDDNRLMVCIRNNMFKYLLEQSNAGQEYQAKFKAWSELGYPGGNINAMQKVEVSNEAEEMEEREKVLDPRAGRVDVVLPQIPFKPRDICELLKEYRFAKNTNSKSRKTITSIISLFEEMSRGNYPLGMKKINLIKDDGYSTKLKQAVNRLVKFEKKVTPNKRKVEEIDNEKPTVKAKRPKIESKIKKKPRNKIEFNPPNYDFSFERESGTWYVYNLKNDDEASDEKPKPVFPENKWIKDKSDKETSTPKVIIQSVVVLKKPNVPQNTPSGAKKVKIDLKLNRSQEIDEHVKQVKSSPGIPFDSAKRPSKPLLKSRLSTPIDPFYIPHE